MNSEWAVLTTVEPVLEKIFLKSALYLIFAGVGGYDDDEGFGRAFAEHN